MRDVPSIAGVSARAFTVPTDAPEADGTLAWDRTTIVIVEVAAGGEHGLGYTYSSAACVPLINETLAPRVAGISAFDIPAAFVAMRRAVRNLGRAGIAGTAVSAVDAALHDLKAKLLGVPLARLLGQCRDRVAIYGSGGFTSYDDRQLHSQLGRFVDEAGCTRVKMKVGSHPGDDVRRVEVARQAIGAEAELFVDANGAYGAKQALDLAARFAARGVTWFEEPVSSDDLAHLRLVREGLPPPMQLAAGEYAYNLDDVRHMLAAGAVDVQQADATRCGGITGFVAVAGLCEAHHIPLSGHCAPALHLHVACAVPPLVHLEWFHDHVRIERMLFDGAPTPQRGTIAPDLSRPGLGLAFKARDAEPYAVDGRA